MKPKNNDSRREQREAQLERQAFEVNYYRL
jgi:hypothetical protein